jgi:cation/acetate symporter
MVTVPLGYASIIILSLLFNKMGITPVDLETKKMIDRIHGWGSDYDEVRYNGTIMPIGVVVISAVIFIWGLQPW